MNDKIKQILKNTLLFFAVFLSVNYLLQSCQKEEVAPSDNGSLIFTTTDTEYGRTKIVTLEIENQTNEEIKIPSECPGEPFDVYRYESNEWVQKNADPKLDCSDAKEITIPVGEDIKINYANWNHALFSDTGRFRIEFATTLKGEPKTIQSNEFTVEKEGIFTQLWRGLFYRPIYNGLIFLTYVSPGHYLGIGIILLTIIIRTILLIPSQKALKSQKRMQDLQPKLDKIKEKYKGDQQKIAMETMATWKEAKVSPMGSCLPMLMQFPFLIALFYVIQAGLNPDNTYLLYTTYANFSIPDINIHFLGLDLTKVNMYVLPIIVGGLQFIQMKMMMAKKKVKDKAPVKGIANEMAAATNMMTYILPVMIAVFTASLPAGVGIYWGVSTLYGIVQQTFVNRQPSSDNNNSDDVKVRVIEK